MDVNEALVAVHDVVCCVRLVIAVLGDVSNLAPVLSSCHQHVFSTCSKELSVTIPELLMAFSFTENLYGSRVRQDSIWLENRAEDNTDTGNSQNQSN